MSVKVEASRLQLRGIRKSFGGTLALDSIDLDVAPGELISVLGASGSGKSTLLRVVAGLEAAEGEVLIGGQSAATLAPKDRGVAFVFQSYALYPQMSVAENIAAPLVMQDLPARDRWPLVGRWMPGARARRAAIAERVRRTASLLQIEALLARRPSELSGGQRQRVALARAIIRRPRLFLLDEPLANLDAALRYRTRTELRALQRDLGTTTLFVTHDQAEAMAISDRIVVMSAGRVRQIGTPDELYRHPVDLDVAQFLSQPVLNMLPAERISSQAMLVEGRTIAMAGPPSGHGTFAFRPENAHIERGEARGGDLPAVVEAVDHAGADAHVQLSVKPTGAPLVARVPSNEIGRWRPGQAARVTIDAAAAWFFPAAAVPSRAPRPVAERAYG